MKFTPLPEDELKQNDYDILPAGTYDFEVLDAKEKTAKSGNDMIELTLNVFESKGKNYRMWDYLVATPKAQFKILNFCEAVGIKDKFLAGNLTAFDCLKKTGLVKVKVETQDNDSRNVVKSYVVSKPLLPLNNSTEKDDDIPF